MEVVFAEEHQVGGEEQYEDEYIDGLPDDGRQDFFVGGVALFHRFLEAVQYQVGVVVDDVAPVYDALSFQYHAAGLWDEAQHVVLLGLAALLVVNDVRLNELVQVVALQGGTMHGKHVVLEDVLIGGYRRVDFTGRNADGLLAVDHADHRRRVFHVARIVVGIHDACLIQLMQALDNQVLDRRRQVGKPFLEPLLEVGDLLFLYIRVAVVIGLERLGDGVALGIQRLLGLEDGEVELGDELPIHPRLALIIVEKRSFCSWKEPNDDSY